jgi:signal transduction histidine kinase
MAEMRSQFVSSVSHELRTPLTAIRMFAETLRMGRSRDERTREEYLETIVNESERLTRLVDNVLDFSRIERGKKTYSMKPAPLEDVVRNAARAVQYPLAQQGFRLNTSVDDGLPPIKADADGLQQAILNLLTNAMKYSGDSREIELRLRRVRGMASIEVTDHGIGIPADEQERIFDKFYRVSTRENQLLPGTGLGLTLVRHVVDAHGGVVKVESAPGRGSTFSIHLPLEDA